MSNRITIKDLKSLCDRLNKSTGSPAESYTKNADGKFTANVGNYHIAQAYGGYNLHRMSSTGGGVTDVLYCGYSPAKELYKLIHAYIRGLFDSKVYED